MTDTANLALSLLAEDEARALTDEIRAKLHLVWDLVIAAYVRRADIALGFESWDAYCSTEFGSSRLGLPREERDEVISSMRAAGMSQRAIASATGLGQRTVGRATEPNGSVGGRVTGLDGKSRPATRPPREEIVNRAAEALSAPTAVEWDEPQIIEPGETICRTCGDTILGAGPVWHCPQCDHHYPDGDACHNCRFDPTPPMRERIVDAVNGVAESVFDDPAADISDEEVEAIADVIEADLDDVEEAASFLEEMVDDAVRANADSKRTPQPQSKPPSAPGVPHHPAKYSDELFPHFVNLLDGYHKVLDPYGGTGKVFRLRDSGHDVVAIELQEAWAKAHPDTTVGNALGLQFADATFDAICTSPTYGNRLADHHNAYDPESRHSYTHDLGEPLHPDNSGSLQWGPEYRAHHERSWAEAVRVLRPGGRFVLNLKDHIRDGDWQDVLGWHIATLCRLGLTVVAVRPVATRSLRTGATANLRVDAEMVVAFDKAGQ